MEPNAPLNFAQIPEKIPKFNIFDKIAGFNRMYNRKSYFNREFDFKAKTIRRFLWYYLILKILTNMSFLLHTFSKKNNLFERKNLYYFINIISSFILLLFSICFFSKKIFSKFKNHRKIYFDILCIILNKLMIIIFAENIILIENNSVLFFLECLPNTNN